MATPPKTPANETTPEQRSEQLRAALARRDAVQTLDTFEATAAPAASPVAGNALDGVGLQLDGPGFGETESTEVTGDATYDEDLAEAADNDLGDGELSEGQGQLQAYEDAKDDTSAFAPSLGIFDRTPKLDDHGDRIPAGSGFGGGGSDSAVTAGGGGGGTNPSAVTGGGRPGPGGSGADAVNEASGHQEDVSGLVGDPRDLVTSGGGNSAAADSDAYHAALGAVTEERMHSTTGKFSVAEEASGGESAALVAAGIVGAAAVDAAVALAGGAVALGAAAAVAAGVAVPILATATAVGAAGAMSAANDATGGEAGERLLMSLPGAAHVAAVANIAGEIIVAANEPATGTLGFGQAAKEVGQAVVRGYESSTLGKHSGGGVRDPGDPDDPDRHGPPTGAELALRAATNRLLGRNDALTHGPATQINPGEQGEIFRAGGPLPDAQAAKQSMIGQPREDGAVPAGGPGGGTPPVGPDGTEILVEDGNPFTGGQRSEGPEDVDFGRDQPLVGLDRGTGDDALPPEEEDDGGKAFVGKRSALDFFDDD